MKQLLLDTLFSNYFLMTSGKIKLMSNERYKIDKAVTNEIIKWIELKN